MDRSMVVVADRARTRFFTLEAPDDPTAGDSRAHLVEHPGLEDEEGRAREGELFEGSKGGFLLRGSGRTHAYDDRRGHHQRAMMQLYADRVGEEIRQRLGRDAVPWLVLVAGPRLLGMLRRAVEPVPEGLQVRELKRDLAHCPVARIRDLLVRAHLVPLPPAGLMAGAEVVPEAPTAP